MKINLFKCVFVFTFVLFMSILAMAVVVAYGRKSGNTGLTMNRVQVMRTVSQ